jgi:hypothetical protein
LKVVSNEDGKASGSKEDQPNFPLHLIFDVIMGKSFNGILLCDDGVLTFSSVVSYKYQ